MLCFLHSLFVASLSFPLSYDIWFLSLVDIRTSQNPTIIWNGLACLIIIFESFYYPDMVCSYYGPIEIIVWANPIPLWANTFSSWSSNVSCGLKYNSPILLQGKHCILKPNIYYIIFSPCIPFYWTLIKPIKSCPHRATNTNSKCCNKLSAL